MEVEITEIPPLEPGEQSLIDMHSVLHVATILENELEMIGVHLADSPDLLGRSLAFCRNLIRSLPDQARTVDLARRLPEYEQVVMDEIVAASTAYPLQAARQDHRDTVDNIRCIFRVFGIRVREILARLQAPEDWVCFPLESLEREFREVFATQEQHTHGLHRVLFNPPTARTDGHKVEFVLQSRDGLSLALPIQLKEVVRDLLTNARESTGPGGCIALGIHEATAELRVVVRDTGCGIPPGDLPTVVRFGRRGKPARGGGIGGNGFGLTKALLVAKQFGGRMWIQSEPGRGTCITLALPRPGAVNSDSPL